MAQAIQIEKPGGPEVLKLVDEVVVAPKKGQLKLSQKAAGVNFTDIYRRNGLYPAESYPAGIGLDGAGTVMEAGEGARFKIGSRVAYCGGAAGAYASERLIDEYYVVPLPDDISEETAAAIMLKGFTVYFLLHRSYKLQKGQTMLVHAAAGGIGLILSQWARHIGATVIGTAGSEEKAELAKKHGCDHVILYRKENFAEKVRELTGGRGVDVVYDGVGKDTFMGSLDALTKFGTLVTFGNASGAAPPFDPLLLSKKGSLYITRPTLWDHLAVPGFSEEAAGALFGLIQKKILNVTISGRYKLADAAQAQRDIEARKTTGSSILVF